MGLRFSRLQRIKRNKTPQKIFKRKHSTKRFKKRIPPPPPRRKSPQLNIKIPAAPPRITLHGINNTLKVDNGAHITQTNTTNMKNISTINNINLQIINSNNNNYNSKNTLNIPPQNNCKIQLNRGASITGSAISNISKLSSVVSMISALSNGLSPSSNAITFTQSFNINNETYESDSSETSLSMITTENETSVSTQDYNMPLSPISPISLSSDTPNIITSSPPPPPTPKSVDFTAKTLSYDGDIESESETDTSVTLTETRITSTNTDSESVQTFIKYDDSNSNTNECETVNTKQIDDTHFNVHNNNNNSKRSSFLTPDMYMPVLPHRLSMTTQVSQLNNDNVKIITWTSTMDVKDVKQSALPTEKVCTMMNVYNKNGGFISVKSTSDTPKPGDIINHVGNIDGNDCYEIYGTKLDINDITNCLQLTFNENNNEKYVD